MFGWLAKLWGAKRPRRWQARRAPVRANGTAARPNGTSGVKSNGIAARPNGAPANGVKHNGARPNGVNGSRSKRRCRRRARETRRASPEPPPPAARDGALGEGPVDIDTVLDELRAGAMVKLEAHPPPPTSVALDLAKIIHAHSERRAGELPAFPAQAARVLDVVEKPDVDVARARGAHLAGPVDLGAGDARRELGPSSRAATSSPPCASR